MRAGASYCDETGGDYYDFVRLGESKPGQIGILVGDVTDHGLQAALFMMSARTILRHHVFHSDDIRDIITDVNMHLFQDVEETGQFMTLFFAAFDADNRRIRWVRAGHDPAIVFDKHNDAFDELAGRGLPLGVLKHFDYEECEQDLRPGQIIVIGTDGIWEARNKQGDMFGKDRLKEIIRTRAEDSAQEIMDRVFSELADFSRPVACRLADDITMVVIKIEGLIAGEPERACPRISGSN